MKDTVHIGAKYWELRSSRGNIILIEDKQLPEAGKERIFLYNTERDAIIEYNEAIVKAKLFPLDEQQQKEAELQFGKAWKIARSDMMNKRKRNNNSSTKQTPPTASNTEEDLSTAANDEDDEFDDAFEE